MSRRIGWLALVTLVIAGWISWLMTPQPVAADRFFGMASTPPEGQADFEMASTSPEGQAHKREQPIPAPPAGRKLGVFDLSTPNKAEEKIQAALVDPKGVDIEFIDTPLRDAVEFIADAKGLPVIIDEQALTEEGIAIDEPINRSLSGVSLSSALKIIFEPIGLTFVVEDEVLKVTTKMSANKKQLTRIYNTGYLKQIGIEPDALKQSIQTVIEPGTWQTSATSNTASHPHQNTRGKSVKAEPKPKNAISVLGDMVVATAPQSVHKKINVLLVQLDRRWELQQATK